MSDRSPRPAAELDGAYAPSFADGVTLVPVADEAIVYAQATSTLHLLDPIATIVCRLFDGRSTIRELAEDLAGAFEVPADRVAQDVLALATDLGSQGLLDGVAGDRVPVPEPRIERDLVDGCDA